MGSLFTTILLQPIFNLTVAVYNFVPGHNLGIAIVILTLIIRLILFPLTRKMIRSQQAMGRLGPKVQEIKAKYKDDQQVQSREIMSLYRQAGVNPLAGCLPLIIQIPVLIALYQSFLALSKSTRFDLMYSFVHNPGTINQMFFGGIDLAQPSHLLAIAAGVLQFLQSHQSLKNQPAIADGRQAQVLNSQMLYFFPVMIIIITWNLPAGLAVYWVSSSVFSIIEQYIIRRQITPTV